MLDKQKRSSSFVLGKDEERYTQLPWYHLHLSISCDINLVEYSYPYSFRNAVVASF